MKLRQFTKWIKSNKGVATSLIEATATVAVGAVLAGVAVGGAIDAINDSKIQAAIGDASSIGQGVITFYKDNAFFPLFKDGTATGSIDTFFQDLVSENGTYPTDSTTKDATGTSFWGVPADPSTWSEGPNLFGHSIDYDTHDSIEAHMVKNVLGNVTSENYPLRGSYGGDPQRGWAGPYVSTLPKTDPWGNKYLINVRELHAGHLLDTAFDTIHDKEAGLLPKLAVIVLSAGPNRTIETPAEQQYNEFKAYGDDVAFRIK